MRNTLSTLKCLSALLGLLALAGCMSGKPRDLSVIQDFEAAPYLGTWYEIARLDHWFEKGLDQCRAEYTLRDDGRVQVVNSGRDVSSGQWKTATGIAKRVGGPHEGRLSVTFFWPFAGGYNILDWQRAAPSYALVCGNTKDYFWILARNRHLPPETLQKIMPQAHAWGIATNKLIWVDQK